MSPPHTLLWFVAASIVVASANVAPRAPDACAVIGGKKWVSPREVRACYRSFKVVEEEKANIIDVISKMAAFHTSTNYQIKAPEPFASEVHEDLLGSLQRIRNQKYASDYELHIDFSRTLKRLNDGHIAWVNNCYDSLFVNYLPTPLSLITDARGVQNVHIAYEAFDVASAEFPDQIDFWQNALPGKLKGNLKSLSGAKVLLINGRPPFDAVHANALITGSYQSYATRQNSFFSSYRRTAGEWSYIMGNFAQQSLPLDDVAVLTIQRVNQTLPETIILPYRSRIGTTARAFTDAASWRANNCVAVAGTNGVDVYSQSLPADAPVAKFLQQPPLPLDTERAHPLNVLLDAAPWLDVTLPPTLQPELVAVNGSYNSAQFYLAKDGKTGVLALGSFSDTQYFTFLRKLLEGLQSLKALGATQLIVDVTNNGGGFICAAHWLHRIIAGPKSSTVPQAGLDTKARAGPLARTIVDEIISKNADPGVSLLYNPLNWRDASNTPFTADADWLEPIVPLTINGREDAFSPRLGNECQPEGFPGDPPSEALFDPTKVVIISNGRCGSSCSLFSISMSKYEGTKTVVVGGKSDVQQIYCGVVGGQSTNFVTIDTEIKTTGLKNSTLAPPDLVVNGVMGITWRLAYGVDEPNEPAEWQYFPADLNLPVTPALANNPVAIWEEVTQRLL